jgi:hypothetical protein
VRRDPKPNALAAQHDVAVRDGRSTEKLKRRREPRLIDVCIARGGVRKGVRVQTFITAWTVASQAMGRPITLDEYAEWWKHSRATAFRHQAAFREVFPALDTPQPIADVAIARGREWQTRGADGIGQLPASVVVA